MKYIIIVTVSVILTLVLLSKAGMTLQCPTPAKHTQHYRM